MTEPHFNGRPWCYLRKVEGVEIDEVFAWIDEQEMDCLCMGVMKGTWDDPDDPEWRSVWSFGTESELLLFSLRFDVDKR